MLSVSLKEQSDHSCGWFINKFTMSAKAVKTFKWGLAKFIAKLQSPVSMGKDSSSVSELLFTWSIKGIYRETVGNNLGTVVCAPRSAVPHKINAPSLTASCGPGVTRSFHRNFFWLVTTCLVLFNSLLYNGKGGFVYLCQPQIYLNEQENNLMIIMYFKDGILFLCF